METRATINLLTFNLDREIYALNLGDVERVIRAVELRPLPGAPRVIRGIFSLHGRIVPVADPRCRLGLPELEIALGDCILIVRTPARTIGLLADGDIDVVACAARDIVKATNVIAGVDLVEGIARLPGGLVLIQSLTKFLSIDEELQLEEAMHAES